MVIDGLRNSNLEKMRNFTEKQLCERLFLIKLQALTLIWVGFLGLRFEMGGGEVELPPRPVLETSNLPHKYTHRCSVRKYTF